MKQRPQPLPKSDAATAIDALASAFASLERVEDIRALVEPFGGVELELPPREPIREPPDFA